MDARLTERILGVLERREPHAAFVSEVAAVIRPPVTPSAIEEALHALGAQRRVLIADHPAPDIHLVGSDLRIVASVPGDVGEGQALEAAEELWSTWLRAFLGTHRCQ